MAKKTTSKGGAKAGKAKSSPGTAVVRARADPVRHR